MAKAKRDKGDFVYTDAEAGALVIEGRRTYMPFSMYSIRSAAVLATPAGYLELCKRHDLPSHWGHPQVLGVFSHASHPNSKLTYKVGLQRDGAADTESSSETFTT